jgi:hypothetical protein
MRRVTLRTPSSSSTRSTVSLPGAASEGRPRRAARRSPRRRGRQEDLERGASPGSLLTKMWPPLCCTMPYTVARPRPVPWPSGLRREEGLEDARLRRLVHARARVRHRDHHVRSGPHAEGAARLVASTSASRRRRDAQRAAVRHRVARVDDEVHQHLLDLPGVGLRTQAGDGARVTSSSVTGSPTSARAASSRARPIAPTSRASAASGCLRLNARSCRVSSAARWLGLDVPRRSVADGATTPGAPRWRSSV